MATLKFRLSSKADKATGQCEVLVRFFHGHFDQYAKTNIFVKPNTWNPNTQRVIIPRVRIMTDEVKRTQKELGEINAKLDAVEKLIKESFINAGAGKVQLPGSWLVDLLNEYNFPGQGEDTKGLLSNLKKYIDIRNEARPKDENDTRTHEGHFEVLMRAFHRFLIVRGYNVGITLDEVTGDTLRDFVNYFQEEHTFINVGTDKDGNRTIEFTNPRFKLAIQAVPESRMPAPRGMNTISLILQRFRTFYHWAIDQGITDNNPFRHFEVPQALYGTPYYITIDERRHLFDLDLSSNPRLAVQRDIFVFQCLIGCRVSDLRNLRKDSVINGAVEYIPRKTKTGHPVTVRVPLNETAIQILERYKDIPGGKLLPCISDQKYNDAIKELFTVAGLTRMVTILNSTTRQEEKRPLNEVASSHLARRTFIGNLYKKVKDPNLIGKLSGHVEGSTAFARYRDIDEEMRKELVSMLD